MDRTLATRAMVMGALSAYSLQEWSYVATIATPLLAFLALIYTARQVKHNTTVSRAQFWLDLRKQFQDHRDIHMKLSHRTWATEDGIEDGGDLSALQSYLGLLEHCEEMLNDGLLDFCTFNKIYGYRIRLLLENPCVVRDVLIVRRSGWVTLVRLLRRIKRSGGLKPRDRYLCGFRKNGLGRCTLWWGYADLEEGAEHFATWEDLERGYHRKLQELKQSSRPPMYAWLRCDHRTLHVLRAKVTAPPSIVAGPPARNHHSIP